jgi:tetratricopeptide (TPR) repeat protein
MTQLLFTICVLSTQDPMQIYRAMNDGNWALAETLIRSEIATSQNPDSLYEALGLTLEKLGRPYEAMEAYQTALGDPDGYPLGRGWSAIAIRHGDLAREFGREEQAATVFRRFEIQRYEGTKRRALREFESVQSLNIPGEAIAAYCASQYLNLPVSKHEWPGLWHTDLAARAVRLAPQWPDAWERLGERLSRDGWNNKAWVAYHEALRRYPSTEKQKIIDVRNRILIMERPRMVEIEDPNDPTGYRMVNVELPGKRFRDGKNPNPRSNIAWPLPGPVPPDWH